MVNLITLEAVIATYLYLLPHLLHSCAVQSSFLSFVTRFLSRVRNQTPFCAGNLLTRGKDDAPVSKWCLPVNCPQSPRVLCRAPGLDPGLPLLPAAFFFPLIFFAC